MEWSQTHFEKHTDGIMAELCAISSEILRVEISTLGAAIVRVCLKDPDGNWTDVALGFDDAADYLNRPGNLGATIGRYAGRIANGRFCLDGKEYCLSKNRGNHTVHGGAEGFHRRLWTVREHSAGRIELELCSPNGDQGFPGTMTVRAVFSVEDSALRLDLWAVSDADTVCSLTNHVYWNLSGHGSGTIDKHLISVPASHYLATDGEKIPTGRILPVGEGVPDLRSPVPMRTTSFDYTYLLCYNGKTHPAGRVWEPESGRCLEVWTDLPAVQVYTADTLPPNIPGKDGAIYGPRSGFCLEAQFYPDAPNNPHFPSAVLRGGQQMHHQIIWKFSLCKEY